MNREGQGTPADLERSPRLPSTIPPQKTGRPEPPGDVFPSHPRSGSEGILHVELQQTRWVDRAGDLAEG